jgi:serine/threonine protein kinase
MPVPDDPIPSKGDHLPPRLASAESINEAIAHGVQEIRRRSSPALDLSPRTVSKDTVELRPAEFSDINELGSGFGGIVYKSIHLPSGQVMARKVINSRIWSAKARKSLAAELATLQKCKSDNIVRYFGAFVSEMQVSIALEFMDIGSLDWICRTIGPLSEPLLAIIAKSVLHGLIYLHRELNIIHRDLKPSNILLNSRGQVKLCDFGESIELVNTLAKSLVGTTGYMAPERVRGRPYTIRSDVWSLGITLAELATGHFPYHLPTSERQALTPITPDIGIFTDEDATLSLVELWEAISSDPAPALSPTHFSPDFINFTQNCLVKEESKRPDPYVLMKHPFITQVIHFDHDLAHNWAQHLLHLKRRSETQNVNIKE